MKQRQHANQRWFKDRIHDAQMSMAELARRLGMHKSALSLALKGSRKIKLEEATKIAEALSLPLDEIMARAGAPPAKGPAAVPLVGAVDVSAGVQPRKLGRVAPPEDLPKGAAAVRYESRGRTMNGWVFFYLPMSTINPAAFGRLSVVRLVDDREVLAVLHNGYEPATYLLETLDGGQRDNQQVIAASPVLLIKPGG